LGARINWLRWIGLSLLGFILWRVDTSKVLLLLSQAVPSLLIVAVLLNIPQIFLKVLRWRWLLHSQHIVYGMVPAILSYFGSIFIGLVTPGRLGEFVRVGHLSKDCNISTGQALSSVLVDRLFDFCALFLVGTTALLTLGIGNSTVGLLGLAGSVILAMLPLAIFMNDKMFGWLKALGLRRVPAYDWLLELRSGLKQLALPSLLAGTMLTLLAYVIFFSQCYLLAFSVRLQASFVEVSFAVALGSLVTLLPISFSGIGTRDAAVVAYLGAVGVTAEEALGFSFLVFLNFYVAGALLGAVAWWMKPASIQIFTRDKTIQPPRSSL